MKIYKFFSLLAICVFLTISCETEDILPAVALTVDTTNLGENSQSVVLTATLNSAALQNVSIPLVFTGTASSSDYTASATNITISSGSKSGSITISSTQDQNIEGPETIITNIGNASGFLVLGMSEITISLLDDDSDSDGDGVLDANDNCPTISGDINNAGCPFLGFLINEVLYDPAAGAEGDANGDGTRDANDDEFIEFFNSGEAIDLSGYTIEDASTIRHTFPTGTIVPVNGVIVVFGGGTPTGTFGGATVQKASEGTLNMSNAGDLVTVKNASGVVVFTFDINPLSGNPNESYTRNPDLTGDFVQHAGVTEANGALFSPGTKLDGSSF